MIKFIIMLILILVVMGFYLLVERKLMGLVQLRFGPNKVMFLGIFQFLAECLKLLLKSQFYLFVFKIKFNLMVLLMLLVSFIYWLFFCYNYLMIVSVNFFIFLMLMMLTKLFILSVFLLLNKSIYVQVSFVRLVVQFISYDILIMLVLIFFFLLLMNLSLLIYYLYQKYSLFLFMNIYLFFIWILGVLMEVLRLPFDFYESESELISGFNLELGSFVFMILFMIEYLDMIYFINLSVMMFVWNKMIFVYLMLLLGLLLWIRVFLIRYRYDKMLSLMWNYLVYFLFLLMIFIVVLVFSY